MKRIEEIDDAELVASIARYSEVALAEAFRRHGGAVYGLAHRVLGSEAQAQAIGQEVFLRLWHHSDRYHPSRGSLRAFLLAETHGLAVHVLRSSGSGPQREPHDVDRPAPRDHDVQNEVSDSASGEPVAGALADLPEGERRAIGLAYFDGQTSRQVSELLGQPEDAVTSTIRTGMHRLRVALAEAGARGVDA